MSEIITDMFLVLFSNVLDVDSTVLIQILCQYLYNNKSGQEFVFNLEINNIFILSYIIDDKYVIYSYNDSYFIELFTSIFRNNDNIASNFISLTVTPPPKDNELIGLTNCGLKIIEISL